MKFTILSHAGISIEHNGVHLITDPWLVGSCYWRSWWNFPEAQPEILSKIQPDYIYLTHLHWDHFHGPSLQKFFDPGTKIIVPKDEIEYCKVVGKGHLKLRISGNNYKNLDGIAFNAIAVSYTHLTLPTKA